MSIDFSRFPKAESFQSFYEAWQAVREGNDLPVRRNIRIQDFAQHTNNLSIVECKKPGFYTHRLLGSSVVDRFGNPDPEVNFLTFYAPDVKDYTRQWLEALLQTPCGGVTEFSTTYQDGTHRSCIALSLPIVAAQNERLLLSLQIPLDIFRVSEPRETSCIGLDYAIGHFFDLGWGLPTSMEQNPVAKPKPKGLQANTNQ